MLSGRHIRETKRSFKVDLLNFKVVDKTLEIESVQNSSTRGIIKH
jgi:hypothetical protein